MKRFGKTTLIVAAAFLLVLVLTCPTKDDYKQWLAQKHDIICDEWQNCKKGETVIDWRSRHIRHLQIYTHIKKDRYTEGNKEYVIRAFGILGHFFDHSSYIIYD